MHEPGGAREKSRIIRPKKDFAGRLGVSSTLQPCETPGQNCTVRQGAVWTACRGLSECEGRLKASSRAERVTRYDRVHASD